MDALRQSLDRVSTGKKKAAKVVEAAEREHEGRAGEEARAAASARRTD